MSASDIAVSVRGLSKAYTIAHNEERQVTLAEQMLQRLKNPFKRTQSETFWALKDVEFDIKKGDVVGIIGRNGAGKSTLLKILSRITEPTAGEIRLYGRVGSLLEVGTGFHPELTGRENIYLNGQILGMRKKEIEKQFDAIVDFAGVEKFLDTPVKRYSSGMYVRLAFAVAAHLESEILIVDEVLAVGDGEFQKKCLGKMKDVSSDGRTVLFVSHNVAAVELLCNRCLFLAKGDLISFGSMRSVVADYASAQKAGKALRAQWRLPPDSPVWIHSAKITDQNDNELGEFPFDCEIIVHLTIEVRQPVLNLQIGLRLLTDTGIPVATFTDSDHQDRLAQCRDPGMYEMDVQLPSRTLLPNNYALLAAAHIPGQTLFHQVEEAATFTISAVGCRRSLDARQGIVALDYIWSERKQRSIGV